MEGGRWSKLFITSVVGGQPATENLLILREGKIICVSAS